MANMFFKERKISISIVFFPLFKKKINSHPRIYLLILERENKGEKGGEKEREKEREASM